MTYISEFLTLDEYECGHCHQLPPDFFINDVRPPYLELLHIFDSVRATWGKPIPVRSGYRCPYHNKRIGGEECSVHCFGLALDMDLGTIDEVEELHSIIDTDFPDVRMYKYIHSGSFIHMDLAYMITPRARHDWTMGFRHTK